MNLSKLSLCLLFLCLACSKPKPSKEVIPTPDGPYKMTATLNGSAWFGSAYASRTMAVAGQSACTTDRFIIGAQTDLPHGSTNLIKGVTGCFENCVPTQLLSILNIPLAVGRYNIAALNACAGQEGAVRYLWLVGGDVIVSTYTSPAGKAGWVEVSSYDSTLNEVEGSFELDLVNKDGQTARFQKGTFKALIQ